MLEVFFFGWAKIIVFETLQIQIKLRWALFVTYTIIQEWNVFSAFNPSKWSSGQPTLRRLGSSWGFSGLLKGLTSVVDTSCQSQDLNPQPWVTSGFKSNLLSIRPRLPHLRFSDPETTIFCNSSAVVLSRGLLPDPSPMGPEILSGFGLGSG